MLLIASMFAVPDAGCRVRSVLPSTVVEIVSVPVDDRVRPQSCHAYEVRVGVTVFGTTGRPATSMAGACFSIALMMFCGALPGSIRSLPAYIVAVGLWLPPQSDITRPLKPH